MIRDTLTRALREAVAGAGLEAPAVVNLERPARREHGDWSSNVALATAKVAGRNPRELARELADALSADPPEHVAGVDVAGPGFVNFRLADSWLHDVLRDVVVAGPPLFARLDIGRGERVQIEFVSANPTGPMHVGNGWFCAYGDALARVLQRCGYDVAREYYVNDTGGQVRTLGASLLARRRGEDVPDDGYQGAYVGLLAGLYDGPDDAETAGRWAAARVLEDIRATLDLLGIRFDQWFSQASIEESDAVEATVALLAARGLVFEQDGALWLRTADFGDPREQRVLRRSSDQGGGYTYLAGDLAYHRDKFLVRGFDRVINVWGADHHGQVASLQAGVEALGVERGRLEVRLGQLVSLAEGRMSKRAGNSVPLRELIDDVGAGAVRFLSLMSSLDQASTIDLDMVRRRSMDNPVFYVQMAYARIAGIGRTAADRGIVREPLAVADLSLLTHERELDVLRSLSELPEVVALAAQDRAPHRVCTWVRELAARFHGFYHDCYVVGDGISPQLTQARLWLVEAARTGVSVGLDLLGVEAPERM